MGRQHTNSAAAASSTASLAQEGTSQRHAHPLHTQLLLWFIIQGRTRLPPSHSCMQPLPASSSTFTHTHAYILTQTMYIKGLIKGLHVFAVTQRYHILCLQSYTSASLNRNRLNLRSKVLSTLTPHHHSDSTPISSPKLVLPSLLLSSILTST